MFYDNFVMLCNERSISPSAAVVEMGFHRSELTRWKGGTTPRRANLLKMAKYFDISVEALTMDEKKPAVSNGGGINEKQSLLLNLFDRLPDAQQKSVIAQLQGLVQYQETLDARSKFE